MSTNLTLERIDQIEKRLAEDEKPQVGIPEVRAVKKICPYRITGLVHEPLNGNHNCAASKCMAWRWEIVTWKRQGRPDRVFKDVWGYCGEYPSDTVHRPGKK